MHMVMERMGMLKVLICLSRFLPSTLPTTCLTCLTRKSCLQNGYVCIYVCMYIHVCIMYVHMYVFRYNLLAVRGEATLSSCQLRFVVYVSIIVCAMRGQRSSRLPRQHF